MSGSRASAGSGPGCPGQSNQAIADRLVVTLDTVKKHVTHLLGKLGAANRTEAVARARELGLVS
jgi:LuxR family maltose regulon positive regulatory protein